VAAHLTLEQRRRVRELRGRGLSLPEVAREVGCSLTTATRVAAGPGKREARQTPWDGGKSRLSAEDREEIRAGLVGGETFTVIAARLGRAISTISREVAANGGRGGYRACAAHDRAYAQARRPKTAKLAGEGALVEVVRAWLSLWWSPQQITGRLRAEFPNNAMMRVSHETIYRSIYVQGRGELRRELARCLRSGRAQRRARQPAHHAGRIPGMVNISERPAEVADRAVPGHWEGDLIIGARGASAVGTLVERTTGYLQLLHLPAGHTAAEVDAAMRRAIQNLPAVPFHSITWDQGKELAGHRTFTIDTGIQVYFCDPHSPWQRATNENTNGLLRQYLPKGTDLSPYSQADLDAIAANLNDRPRQRLGFMKPSERLAELLATTP
jgi:IS30 family transposase